MFNRKKYNKQYYIKNKIKILKYKKQYYIENSKRNKENKRRNDKRYRENNVEKIREGKRQYRLDNADKLRKYFNNKNKTDLKYNLNHRIRAAIRLSLKGNKRGRHWEDLVGYTINDLIKRLKRTMPKNYTWQDFLKGELHIDHIIPISAHNFSKAKHIGFKRCWALKNLQLLPAKENKIKSNKLDRPFQPALRLKVI